MNNRNIIFHSRALPRRSKGKFSSGLLLAMLSLVSLQSIRAGSATWNLNPTSSDWNNAANWTPATVPNGPDDIATFALSNTPDLSLSAETTVDGIVFNPGASAFTVTTGVTVFAPLIIGDAGVTNNSGVTQNFVAVTAIYLGGSANAGTDTVYTINGSASSASLSGVATAGEATFISNGGTMPATAGALLDFLGASTGGNGTVIATGGTVSGAGPGLVRFYDHSKADNATLIAYPGSETAMGGSIEFYGQSEGGTPRVEVFGNGQVNLGYHGEQAPDVVLGSIEGDGKIQLGAGGQGFDSNVIVGSNNLSTTFSGIISGGFGGSLAKIGSGTLTLSGANTYTGGTTVSAGVLLAANTTGSATGTAAVSVKAGALGGPGIISGAVTIGGGASAILAPAIGSRKPATLTVQQSLSLQPGAKYIYSFKASTNESRTDLVIANGVTINGAKIALNGKTQGNLTPGLVLTLISNTSANPISGTFGNLADGAIVTVDGNNFQANYQGGDGNDLTLTVMP